MGYDILHRDSHWRQPVRKKVLINFTKFTGKPMCHSLFFLFFVFSCEFYKISKNIFFTEHLQVTVTACKKQIEKQPPEVCNKILVPHEIGELIFYYSCSIKKAVLKNLAIFTGKHLCWSLFLINFIKKRLHHEYFPENIAELLRIPIIKSICERLLIQEEGGEGQLFYKNKKK